MSTNERFILTGITIMTIGVAMIGVDVAYRIIAGAGHLPLWMLWASLGIITLGLFVWSGAMTWPAGMPHRLANQTEEA